MHIWDWFVADHFQLAPQLSFGFSTLTKSPVAGANSPCDGDCYMQGAGGGAYSTAHNASSSTSATATGTNLYIQNYYSSGGGGVYILSRGFVLFDTSSLTSGATISGAVMSLWAVYRTEANAGQAVIHIVASTPANTNNIVADDYDQTGSTSFASSAVTTAQYNNFTLNASGITNVSKTGISKFGIRLDGDLNSSTPTGANEVDIRAADYTTPGQEPYLVVTYTSTIGIQLNIADSWKQATAVKVNIGDAWKPVTKAQINIGDIWKSIF